MEKRRLDIVQFAGKKEGDFFATVNAGVGEYFRVNHISPFASAQMWIKTAIMLSLYIVPYVLMVTGLGVHSPWVFFGLWFLMAWGMVGIGTSIMHDANHGTYSSKQSVNTLMGRILELIGGYTVTWKIQHNVLHHTYTNIAGLDEDITNIKLLRFSPRQPRYWFHRYQYIYAWFFYMIMTLFWMTAKDYVQVLRYKKHDLLARQKVSFAQALFRITMYKLFYYFYILVLPILYSGMPWYYVIFGFLLMHFTAGIFLSCIFQPSHVVESSAFAAPIPSEGKRKMEDSWAVHEIVNTTNFAPHNKLLTWFAGGLNFQIEHHLFTSVCHVHFPKIAPIVKAVALTFALPYHEEPTFLKALGGHMRMLKQLGRE